MRQRSIVFMLAFALALPLMTAAPALADDGAGEDGTVVAARVGGDLPASGVVIAIWDGGSVLSLQTDQPEISSIFVAVNGSLIGYLPGAPTFVNQQFLARFPQGQVAAGTGVLALVDQSKAPTNPTGPIVTTGYSLATWNAFVDTLLRPNFEVTTCPSCWPSYQGGSTIGVTVRWLEGQDLKVYVYSGTTDDILAMEAQLDDFQERLGLNWSYVTNPANANLNVFMNFDRHNVPASFPAWAKDDLAAQNLVPDWAAYTSTNFEYQVGPNGAVASDRFDITTATVYVPFNLDSGQMIGREFLDTHLRHELVHAIGWSDHWNVPGRLMSPVASTPLSLSELEWDMLSLLYDDLVEPGMYQAQLLNTIDILN